MLQMYALRLLVDIEDLLGGLGVEGEDLLPKRRGEGTLVVLVKVSATGRWCIEKKS